MKIHIYRPPLFGLNLRKFNFYDERGKKLSYLTEDSQIVLKGTPEQIKIRVGWLRGKTQKLEGDEVFLIVYFVFGGLWQWFNPADCKNYFKFKELSREEYMEAVKTHGESLELEGNTAVSKAASITSRVLSVLMLAFVGILFYYTDYAGLSFPSDQIDFIRFLALLIGLGSIANLIGNFDNRISPYPKVFLLVLFSVYFYWQINSTVKINAVIVLLPALLAIALSGFYAVGNIGK